LHYCTPPVLTSVLHLSSSSRLAARATTQRKRYLQRLRIDTHPCSMKKENGIGFRQSYERNARSQLWHAAYSLPCDKQSPYLPQSLCSTAPSVRRTFRFALPTVPLRYTVFSLTCVGSCDPLCPQLPVAHVADMRRTSRLALPAVFCSTCLVSRYASNLTIRFAYGCP